MSIISSVFIATSLDGFIARKNGDLDWLDKANQLVPEGTDLGFETFMNSVDTMIIGRKTYEKVLSFGLWPYGDKPVIVLSRNKVEIPSHLTESVYGSSETPKDLCKRLSSEGVKRLYIDGGYTIQQFLAEDLIDDITITTIPVILGEGIPLFNGAKRDILLKHVKTISFDFGFVQTTYRVIKNSLKYKFSDVLKLS